MRQSCNKRVQNGSGQADKAVLFPLSLPGRHPWQPDVLTAVIQLILQRMDKGTHAQVFGRFQLDIGIKKVIAEHTATQQEFTILIQRIQRLLEAATYLRNMARLFWRQIVQVFVGRVTWVDAVLD